MNLKERLQEPDLQWVRRGPLYVPHPHKSHFRDMVAFYRRHDCTKLGCVPYKVKLTPGFLNDMVWLLLRGV